MFLDRKQWIDIFLCQLNPNDIFEMAVLIPNCKWSKHLVIRDNRLHVISVHVTAQWEQRDLLEGYMHFVNPEP